MDTKYFRAKCKEIHEKCDEVPMLTTVTSDVRGVFFFNTYTEKGLLCLHGMKGKSAAHMVHRSKVLTYIDPRYRRK